jgi:hypothetical protein
VGNSRSSGRGLSALSASARHSSSSPGKRLDRFSGSLLLSFVCADVHVPGSRRNPRRSWRTASQAAQPAPFSCARAGVNGVSTHSPERRSKAVSPTENGTKSTNATCQGAATGLLRQRTLRQGRRFPAPLEPRHRGHPAVTASKCHPTYRLRETHPRGFLRGAARSTTFGSRSRREPSS